MLLVLNLLKMNDISIRYVKIFGLTRWHLFLFADSFRYFFSLLTFALFLSSRLLVLLFFLLNYRSADILFNKFSLVEGRTRSSENDSVSEILHIDDSDDIAEKKTLESGATVASSFSSLKPSTDYSLGHLESKCDTSGAKSRLTRAKIPGCSVTDGKSFRGTLFADVPIFLNFSCFKLYILLTNA